MYLKYTLSNADRLPTDIDVNRPSVKSTPGPLNRDLSVSSLPALPPKDHHEMDDDYDTDLDSGHQVEVPPPLPPKS